MKPLSLIVTTIARLFSWFVITFGVIVILNGHNTPGGGFQGGAIVATAVCLLLVAWGGKRFTAWVRPNIYTGLESTGLLAFLFLAFLGLPNSFTYNFLSVPSSAEGVFAGWLPSCGTISLMNVSVGFEVIGALSLTVIEIYEGSFLANMDRFGGECGHDR
jgi:multicomponent Na+:H+ antiporter subunit B